MVASGPDTGCPFRFAPPSPVPSSVSSTLNFRGLVISLVAAYLLLTLGWRGVQAVFPAPEGSFVEVVWTRVADGANSSAANR